MKASCHGYIEVVRELINRGADINAKDKDKNEIYKDKQHWCMELRKDL